jgi:hypothetical protein
MGKMNKKQSEDEHVGAGVGWLAGWREKKLTRLAGCLCFFLRRAYNFASPSSSLLLSAFLCVDLKSKHFDGGKILAFPK